MVDMIKKINKKCPELLQPGEEIVAACIVSPRGQFKKTAAFGAIGGAVGAVVGAAISGRSSNDPSVTQASLFPLRSQSILALSNQRWILFEQGSLSGAPKSILGHGTKDELIGLQVEAGKLISKLELQFTDHSIADMESPRGSKPGDFVATFNAAL